MKMRIGLAIALLGICLTGYAQVDLEVPETPDATYMTADGKEVREYDVSVWRVGREHITVQFSNGELGTYRVPRDFRFDIEGTPTPLSGIYPRQDLQAYLTYDNGMWQLVDPGSIVDDVIEINTVAEAAPEEDLEPAVEETSSAPVPRTASPLPLIGLAGLALVGLAGGVRRLRHR